MVGQCRTSFQRIFSRSSCSIYHSWIEEFEKLFTNLNDETEYVVQISNLKQALNRGLDLKKFRRVIKFHTNAWIKPHIHTNTKLKQKAKNNFEKDFFNQMNNPIIEKLWNV